MSASKPEYTDRFLDIQRVKTSEYNNLTVSAFDVLSEPSIRSQVDPNQYERLTE